MKKTKLSFFKQKFIEKATKIFGNKYDYSQVEYISERTKVKIICPIHGEFWQTPQTHLLSEGCQKCRREKVNSQNARKFKEEANLIHENYYDYSFIEYNGSLKKVCVICPEHGEFWQTPAHHLEGAGCPKCNSSKGEKEIRKWLKENNILFEEQKRFSVCKDEKPLSYDFYVPERNLLIEYNGAQHYKAVEQFGGEKRLRLQRHHDWLKRKFAKDNDYKLLIIPYWKFEDISEILRGVIDN